MWFLSKARPLKTPQRYRESVSHQHKIRIHFRLNPEVPELEALVVIPSDWNARAENPQYVWCRDRLKPAKGFYEGWLGACMNFPPKDNSVLQGKLNQNRSSPLRSDSLDLSLELWGFSLGMAEEGLFLLLLWKQNSSTSLARTLCS